MIVKRLKQNGSGHENRDQQQLQEYDESWKICSRPQVEEENTRELAELEWEWLASILEKSSCFFCLFMLVLISGLLMILGFSRQDLQECPKCLAECLA